MAIKIKLLHKILTSPQISIVLRKIVENNFKKQKKIIKKYFATRADDQVLDIGCGTGEFSVFFPAENYIGIDIDLDNIKYANKHYQRKFLVADGKKLPFKNNHFTKVLVLGVFHHLSDANAQMVLSEIKRVLRPDGRLLVMEDTRCANLVTNFLQHFDQGEFIRTGEEWLSMFSRGWGIEQNFTFKNGISFYTTFLLNPKIIS